MRRVECTRDVVVTQWFIQANDGQPDRGPLRPNELLRLVRGGEVTRGTKIRRDGETDWFPASDVGGLFEAAMRPTIQHFCPNCDSELSDPPEVCRHCGHKVRKAVTKITENAIISREDQPQPNSPRPIRDGDEPKKRVSGQGTEEGDS